MARPLLLALPLMGGCLAEPARDVTRDGALPPPVAGLCHTEGVRPAKLETVSEQVVETPAMTLPDGTILRPARYATRTRTEVVTPREVSRFETPCALRARDPDFVMQLQRALAVRGLYKGPVDGSYDDATRIAVTIFQETLGLESGELSTEAARALGLVAMEREG